MKFIGWVLGLSFPVFFTYVFHSALLDNNAYVGNKEKYYPSESEHIVKTDDVSNAYITVAGIYRVSKSKQYSSICLSKRQLEGYRYITIEANKEYATRIHFLKEEPLKQNKHVKYSDYYQNSLLVRKGMKMDIVIPKDAKCVYILNSKEGHNNTPDYIALSTAEVIFNKTQILSERNNRANSHKFMHWNIGNFSKGKYPYSTITKDNYSLKLDGFNKFINTYCPDCHYLLNEYNETFAKIDGKPVAAATVLFDKRKTYKDFPRSTSSGYNKLAIFGKEGLYSYRYGVFESLKGVKNKNGTLEYGLGYCISQYNIGGTTLYVMSLHAPNSVTADESNALYKEILSIVAGLDNCILVGDFNRKAADRFSVLTDAGFKILNDKSVTYLPGRSILDWVLFRCKNVTLSDFRVYTEAVDGNGEFLSDHLPLSFTATYNARN